MNICGKLASVIFQFVLVLAQEVFLKQNEIWVMFT